MKLNAKAWRAFTTIFCFMFWVIMVNHCKHSEKTKLHIYLYESLQCDFHILSKVEIYFTVDPWNPQIYDSNET
jgi:hypothetical protein